MTATTAVLSCPSLTTTPSRTFRRFGRAAASSAILVLLFGGFGGSDLAVAQDRVDAGDVLLHLTDSRVVVELPSDQLEAQVEELGLGLHQLRQQLVVGRLAQLGRSLVRHQTATSSDRMMNFALIGSFWMARSMAARARSSLTPASSNITRPGFTTATQRSGLPLPEPMRVSAGFWVTGLSGKMLIQTLPPRRTWRVIAIRAASIWRAVIQPGSKAWMPKSPNTT